MVILSAQSDDECQCGGVLALSGVDGEHERLMVVRVYRCLQCGARVTRDSHPYTRPALLSEEEWSRFRALLLASHGWVWRHEQEECRRCGAVSRRDRKDDPCPGARPPVPVVDDDLW